MIVAGHGRGEQQASGAWPGLGDDPRSAWMKPMSSIWSASSRTRIWTSRRSTSPGHEVEQAAGRGDEDVDAARDRAQALRIGNAAENDADRQAHEAAVGFGAGGDLRGELTRRREHQHADLARLRDVAIGRQAVERGQHKRRRLAGAGLGNAEEIAAGQDRRDRLMLDRRRLRIILRRKRVEQGLGKPKIMKRQ